MKIKIKRRQKQAILICLAATILLMLFFPRPLTRQLRGVCFVECESRYALALPGGDTLRFVRMPDAVCPDAQTDDFTVADTARLYGNATGFFVSPDGHVVTSAAVIRNQPPTLAGERLRQCLLQLSRQLTVWQNALEHQKEELDYYHRRHSITDEGYTMVESHRELVGKKLELLGRLHESCERALRLGKKATATLECSITIDFREMLSSGEVVSRRVRGKLCAAQDDLLLIQADCGTLPEGATRFSPYWLPTCYWMPSFVATRMLGFPLIASDVPLAKDDRPDVVPADTALAALWPEGAPVTDVFGHLSGVVVGGKVVAGNRINRILEKEGSFPARLFRNMASTVRNFFYGRENKLTESKHEADSIVRNIRAYWLTDTTMRKALLPVGAYVGQWKDDRPAGKGLMRYADGNRHRGHWRGGMRWGYGTTTTPQGRSYTGFWEADTLAKGIMTDSTGRYEGGFNKALEREGYGIWQMHDGNRYEGEWVADLRQGFGFSIEADDVVKCGIWKRHRFSGEEMDFTRNRVYGIDISRYQHESGRKRYRINWESLRITRLGAKGRKVKQGDVDYPVSFVYVKATQGTTIKSAYYAADAAAARKRGIPVGAYHFFSPKSGLEQARYFLKTAAPHVGDLPPMLDVELTDAQIVAMGGPKAMFREMKIWMQTVEAHCGVRPVLYVGQQFVNQYLSVAPPEWKAYDTWVARYGEYKPYVHLLYWQLSPYGRVAGIHGAVDINVYNGTQEQFQEYVKEHRVRSRKTGEGRTAR